VRGGARQPALTSTCVTGAPATTGVFDETGRK
jgi:hypothetical protein